MDPAYVSSLAALDYIFMADFAEDFSESVPRHFTVSEEIDDEQEEFQRAFLNEIRFEEVEEAEKELDFIFMEDYASDSDEEKEEPIQKRSKKMGRPPLTDIYPQMIPILESFIYQHGAAAHDRRHEETVYSHGVSLMDMRRCLMNRIPELKRDVQDPNSSTKLSLSAIHHCLIAPRQNSGAQKRDRKYRGLIKVKVAKKRNTLIVHKHMDGHFAAAQFKYAREFAECFPHEVFVMTCDDKNKLTMGLPSVHHLNQQKSFYPTDDTPNLPDHDFPSGHKLTPSGYAFLKHRSDPVEKRIGQIRKRIERKRGSSLDRARRNVVLLPRRRSYSADCFDRFPKEFSVVDRNLRPHMDYPHTGPVHLFIKPDMFHQATSELHANHLWKLIQKESMIGRNSGVILCDGGPDWNFRFSINLFNYGRLWWDLGLDCLIFTCYAPGESRFNPIEHLWAVVNLWFGKSLVPGSLKVGSQEFSLGSRGGFYDGIICEKAVDTMVKYCSSDKDFIKQWNGFLAEARGVPNSSEWKIYNDHQENKASIMKPREENAESEVLSFFRFLLAHCVRTKYMLQFKKDNCPDCKKQPIRTKNCCRFLDSVGGQIPVPKLATLKHLTDDGKQAYESFGDRCVSILSHFDEPLKGDQGIASAPNTEMFYCPEGCKFYFYNGMDLERHMKIAHGIYCMKDILPMKQRLFQCK